MGTGSAAQAPASARILSRLTALALLTLFLGLGLGPVTVARAEVDAAHASSGRQGPRMGRSGPAFLDGGFDASDVIWDDDGVDAFLRAAARSKARQKALTQDQERRRYLSSASLASYLGIQSVKAVHVPVPVNLILVGFSGEGHMGLKLDHADLVAWLEHADHVRPHARLPAPTHAARPRARSRSIRTPGKKAAGSSPLQQLDEAPTNSVARFNFTCHVVDVGVKVTAVLERAMRLYSRPLRPVNPLGDETRLRHSRDSVAAHHVDAKAFSALVDDLVADLEQTVGLRLPAGKDVDDGAALGGDSQTAGPTSEPHRQPHRHYVALLMCGRGRRALLASRIGKVGGGENRRQEFWWTHWSRTAGTRRSLPGSSCQEA